MFDLLSFGVGGYMVVAGFGLNGRYGCACFCGLVIGLLIVWLLIAGC